MQNTHQNADFQYPNCGSRDWNRLEQIEPYYRHHGAFSTLTAGRGIGTDERFCQPEHGHLYLSVP